MGLTIKLFKTKAHPLFQKINVFYQLYLAYFDVDLCVLLPEILVNEKVRVFNMIEG